jgi:hypothetical protein
MQKWEYMVVSSVSGQGWVQYGVGKSSELHAPTNILAHNKHWGGLVELLTSLGDAGWEMLQSEPTMILKRPKQ